MYFGAITSIAGFCLIRYLSSARPQRLQRDRCLWLILTLPRLAFRWMIK